MPAGEQRPLTVQEAYDALDAFGRRAGHVPLRLLLHLSVPQSFRADLVNLLKQNFLSADAGGDLTVDADLLFSPLVQRGAAGYYRLDPEVRRHGVALLDATYRDQRVRRSVEVGRFLLAYAEMIERQAGLALDPLLSEYLAIQRWVALSFIDPAAAASAFAAALADVAAPPAARGSTASLRIGGVTSAIAVPLSGHAELLAYARGLDALHQGQGDAAQRMLGWMGDQELKVGTVALRPGRQVLADWQDRLAADATSTSSTQTSEPSAAGTAATEATEATGSTPTGATRGERSSGPLRINVPAPLRSGQFVARHELQQLRSLLLEQPTAKRPGQPASGPGGIRVIGPDGSGRWTIANNVAHDAQVLAAFPDGIVWIDEGGSGYPTQALAAYAEAVGVPDVLDGERSFLNRERFRSLLAERRVLIIAEQRVASRVLPTIFEDCGPLCTVLHLTDYDPTPSVAPAILLTPLDPSACSELLSRAEPPLPPLPPEWQEYAAGNPLLVRLAAGAARRRAAVPTKPTEDWKVIDALVLAVWRTCPRVMRARLRAIAALRPEHRSLFAREELEQVAGKGIVEELRALGMADLLADGLTVKISRPARGGLSSASDGSDDDAPPETDAIPHPAGPARVLISFASEDESIAKRVAETLERAGMPVFFVTEFAESTGGSAISELLRPAAVVLIILSRASARNSGLQFVAALAMQERAFRGHGSRMVIPVVVDEVPVREMPGPLQTVQRAEAPNGVVDEKFVEDIRGLVTSFEPRPHSSGVDEAPSGSPDAATGPDEVSTSPGGERTDAFIEQADVAREPTANVDLPGLGDRVPFDPASQQAAIVGSAIICFTENVRPDQRRDLVNASLLAHLVADKKFPDASDRAAQDAWSKEYFNVLSHIGFGVSDTGTAEYSGSGASFEAFDAVLAVARTLLPGTPMQAIVTKTLESLKAMGTDTPWIDIFNRESVSANTARFHVALADVGDNGMSVSTVLFRIAARAEITQVLFFKFRRSDATLNYSSAKLSVNELILTGVREQIAQKVAPFIDSHVAGLNV